VEAFFDEISEALSHNEQIKLSGFGNFDLRDKRQRPGRNPRPARKSRSVRAALSPSGQGRS